MAPVWHRLSGVLFIVIILIGDFSKNAKNKIRAYFKFTHTYIFALPVIHIRQTEEVCTIVHTAIRQNYTKLPNRIQVLD